jgi:hypothetical protein
LFDLLRPSSTSDAQTSAATELEPLTVDATCDAAFALPAPAVAVPLSADERGAQRRAAAARIMGVEARSLVIGATASITHSVTRPDHNALAAAGAQSLRQVLLPRVLQATADASIERTFLEFLSNDYVAHEVRCPPAAGTPS